MTDEKWQEISSLIENKYQIENHVSEDLNPGTLEYYIFIGPLGKMKLERTTKPRLLDRQVIASHRIGGDITEKRVYSENENVSYIKAYSWNDDMNDWSEIQLNDLI